MVATLVGRKINVSLTSCTQETIDELFNKFKDDYDFGVKPEYLNLAKRIFEFNLRQGRRYRSMSKYFFVNGKCINLLNE